MTRAEHLEWCKQRARQYIAAGQLRDAVASMASDLNKHPETSIMDNPMLRGLTLIAGVEAVKGNRREVERFVEGFN